MLCAGVVHGDLSEYNILMSVDGPVIIDFPQATDAANNQNSERIFLRDVKNLKNYLGKYAPQLKDPIRAGNLGSVSAGKLFPDSPLTGRVRRKDKRVDTAPLSPKFSPPPRKPAQTNERIPKEKTKAARERDFTSTEYRKEKNTPTHDRRGNPKAGRGIALNAIENAIENEDPS